ncbi:5-formyltetrahydrofolate cyclo-ligase [Ilumatobacter coccineus]|uniref:Putative 5-formyltetrahydrofolate cyclo-ligase n=1 Tax=Ilumatobacter coccineus (strain NBRC 103263 / KCTC 29153 / YM16-304) TaxID=1313172 RepID=A0A6C7E7N1_ILUCY|nr:5-formyltetrahydrofolate cyclo-ligase [Ilumatobacter coccineus]BAN03674.1 putative 5-formyltetrahydrofolate cyclo-ligase [Ilumatobacter coccineus YM16-304]
MDAGGDDAATAAAKRSLRREARERRKALTDRHERSARLTRTLIAHPAVIDADRVMAYSAMGSEVDTAMFVAWCIEHGKAVLMPEDGVDPSWPDVVIVPGLAFTLDGHRCGQGGGWYDRFLPGIRADCVTIGVGFRVQLVDELPIGPFDQSLDIVLTD